MKTDEQQILNNTHYGIKIYAHVLNQYYEDYSVLTQIGNEFKTSRNPFNADKETLAIKIIDGCATHEDLEVAIPEGNAFDFAALHFKLKGPELLDKLNEVLHLRLNLKEKESEQDAAQKSQPSLSNSIYHTGPEFSFYSKPASNVKPKQDLNLVDAYMLIKGPSFEFITSSLRSIIDLEEKKEFKRKNFDYATFSGTFSSRKDSNLKKHSGLMTLDFDYLLDVAAFKKELLEDQYLETELLFVSPSGKGLKCIIKVDLTKGTHQEHFVALSNYIKATYDLEVDKSGKDVSRACFLCHDPEVYINPKYLGKVDNRVIKPFELKKWLNKPERKDFKSPPTARNTASHVEEVIQQIESVRIDLTETYYDWVMIGFALANEFGENGRDYFHRVSQFHPGYSWEECDKQYTYCIKSTGSGVTIGSFFQKCSSVGIKYTNTREVKESKKLEKILKSSNPQLPHFLKRITDIATSDAERDIFLLGSIGVLSACLPNIYGIYGGQKVYPNLFVFITGSASAGKGKLSNCKFLVKPIHDELRNEANLLKEKYKEELAQYNSKKPKDRPSEKPLKPVEKLLFIPANNSSSGAYLLLGKNNGVGLIFETEGDTLALAFKTDYGNYSDGFRKAFHHEPIEYYRKTDDEYVSIENPRLSAVLSGTPNQIHTLVPSAENGLFSRFIFYYLEINEGWVNNFICHTAEGLNEYFENLGYEFQKLYKVLMDSPEIRFSLTSSQEVAFNRFFDELQTEYMELLGEEYIATVRRLGLITFRICMILSALRMMENGHQGSDLLCEDQDFETAISMVKVLVQHSEKVFKELPEERKNVPRKDKRDQFFEALPIEFNRQKYLEVAKTLGIVNKTAERWIKAFYNKGVLNKEKHDKYLKNIN
jgi:hypothetical protein